MAMLRNVGGFATREEFRKFLLVELDGQLSLKDSKALLLDCDIAFSSMTMITSAMVAILLT